MIADLTKTIDEIVENLRNVKGQDFSEIVMYAFMARQQMKLHARAIALASNDAEWAMKQGAAFCTLSSSMLAMYGVAKNIKKPLFEEALAFADTLYDRLKETEAKLND